jgi:hypothetical protein
LRWCTHTLDRLQFTKAKSVSVCVWTEVKRAPMSLSVYNACCFDHARRAWMTTLVMRAMQRSSAVLTHTRAPLISCAPSEVQLNSHFSCRVDERTPFYSHDAPWREHLRRPQSTRRLTMHEESCRHSKSTKLHLHMHTNQHGVASSSCSLESASLHVNSGFGEIARWPKLLPTMGTGFANS